MAEGASLVLAAREWAAAILCLLASMFAVAGTIGVFRFPDAYTRLHASSLAGTTAVFSALLAALVAAPSLAIAARIVVVMLFFLVSNPTATHIIARYAWKSGIDPWTASPKAPRRRGLGRDDARDEADEGRP